MRPPAQILLRSKQTRQIFEVGEFLLVRRSAVRSLQRLLGVFQSLADVCFLFIIETSGEKTVTSLRVSVFLSAHFLERFLSDVCVQYLNFYNMNKSDLDLFLFLLFVVCQACFCTVYSTVACR